MTCVGQSSLTIAAKMPVMATSAPRFHLIRSALTSARSARKVRLTLARSARKVRLTSARSACRARRNSVRSGFVASAASCAITDSAARRASASSTPAARRASYSSLTIIAISDPQLARHAAQALDKSIILDIQVPLRGRQRTVAEQFLNLPRRYPLIVQTAGTLMSQIMPIQIGILGDDPMMGGALPSGRDRVPIFAGVEARRQQHSFPIRPKLRQANRGAVPLARDGACKAPFIEKLHQALALYRHFARFAAFGRGRRDDQGIRWRSLHALDPQLRLLQRQHLAAAQQRIDRAVVAAEHHAAVVQH